MIDRKKMNTLKACSLIAVMVMLIFAGGCKKKKPGLVPGEASGTAKQIFEKARRQIKKNPEKARMLFKEILHLYPDDVYAQRSKVGIADSYFKQKDSSSLLMAAAEYQEYVNLFPNSPDSVYAKYQIAMCYYKQMRKPGRDQEFTVKAIATLESMAKMFPETEEAEDARKKIKKARDTMAMHYFLIGRTNFRLKAYRGALNRFKQVIDNYPDFKKNDVLFFYTGRCYYAMWDFDSALSFFQRIVTDHPKSKFFKKSRKMIEKCNFYKKNPPKRKIRGRRKKSKEEKREAKLKVDPGKTEKKKEQPDKAKEDGAKK